MNNKFFKLIIEFKWIFIILFALLAVFVTLELYQDKVKKSIYEIAKNVTELLTPDFTPADTFAIIVDTISPIVIQKIEQKGDVYALCAELEEMSIRKQTQYERYKWTGIVKDSAERKCVQTIKQKCIYKFSLNDVEYCQVPDSGKIFVRMPDLRYVAHNLHTDFIPDDKRFWGRFNNDRMKGECETKIKNLFCTKENKQIAMNNAKRIVASILTQLGYDVCFVENNLEQYERPERYEERKITIKRTEPTDNYKTEQY